MKKYLVPVVGSNLAGVMEFTIEAASEEEAKEKVAGVREGKIDPKDIGLSKEDTFALHLVLDYWINKPTEVKEEAEK